MGTKSVQLDYEAEKALSDIVELTGLSISDAIKQGLIAFREQSYASTVSKPADFFKSFDLGEGGYSLGPARRAKALLKEKLRSKRSSTRSDHYPTSKKVILNKNHCCSKLIIKN